MDDRAYVLLLLNRYGKVVDSKYNRDSLRQLEKQGLVEVAEVDKWGRRYYKLVEGKTAVIAGIAASEMKRK